MGDTIESKAVTEIEGAPTFGTFFVKPMLVGTRISMLEIRLERDRELRLLRLPQSLERFRQSKTKLVEISKTGSASRKGSVTHGTTIHPTPDRFKNESWAG